jgi:hypothetical protein
MRPSAKHLSNDSLTGCMQLPDCREFDAPTNRICILLGCVSLWRYRTRIWPQPISSDLGFVMHAERILREDWSRSQMTRRMQFKHCIANKYQRSNWLVLVRHLISLSCALVHCSSHTRGGDTMPKLTANYHRSVFYSDFLSAMPAVNSKLF